MTITILIKIKIWNASVGFSESGWTDREQAAQWISNVFIPCARSKVVDITKPIILTIDGHDSHECLDIKHAVYESQGDATVIVFAFPSKCTHKVQPLDVGIFNHTQQAWKKICDDLVARNKPMTRYTVIPEYMRMQRGFLTSHLIKNSLKATGISPLNPNIFTDEDFAPSQTFSTSAHVPESYPPDIPSSDPAIPSDGEPVDVQESSDSDSYSDSDSEMKLAVLCAPRNSSNGRR